MSCYLKLTPSAQVRQSVWHMGKVKINYEGALRCVVEHEQSGKTFYTDAPVDNCGKGESFSPTDLCASALGSCIATIVGMELEKLASGPDGYAHRSEQSDVGEFATSDHPLGNRGLAAGRVER